MSASALHILCKHICVHFRKKDLWTIRFTTDTWNGGSYKCHPLQCWGHCVRAGLLYCSPLVTEMPQKLLVTSKSSCLYSGLSLWYLTYVFFPKLLTSAALWSRSCVRVIFNLEKYLVMLSEPESKSFGYLGASPRVSARPLGQQWEDPCGSRGAQKHSFFRSPGHRAADSDRHGWGRGEGRGRRHPQWVPRCWGGAGGDDIGVGGLLLERCRAVAVLQPERVWARCSTSGFRVMRPTLYLAGAPWRRAQELVRSLF